MLKTTTPDAQPTFAPASLTRHGDLLSRLLPGTSDAMTQLRNQVARLAPHFRRVLITSEAGGHRERLARSLHAVAPATQGSFLVCATTDIEESAALWKQDPRVGRLALRRLANGASGGMIWIDDVATLSLAAQGFLLRLLDERTAEGERLRLAFGTAANLKAMSAAGSFLAELRLSIAALEVSVPPLRSRTSDLAELVHRTTAEVAQEYAIGTTGVADSMIAAVTEHMWPGNETELENALRMAVLSSGGGLLEAAHLPALEVDVHAAVRPVNAPERLQEIVDQHLLHILALCNGNKLRAADRLGVSRSTLYRMLEACANAGRAA